jgi:hypothetical protein
MNSTNASRPDGLPGLRLARQAADPHLAALHEELLSYGPPGDLPPPGSHDRPWARAHERLRAVE